MKLVSTAACFHRKFCTVILLAIWNVCAFAQENTAEGDPYINRGNDDWYKQPWVWIVSAVVVILLVLSIIGKKKQVYKETTPKTDDVIE